jgi:hypothetical protein
MKRFWAAIVAFVVAFVGAAGSADAKIFRWKDKRGAVHITDDWNDVPDFARLEIIKKRPGATAPGAERRSWAVRASAARRGEGGTRRAAATEREATRPTGRGTEAPDARGELAAGRVVVLDADGIRVPPEAKENRAFWEDLVRSWKKQLGEVKEALETVRQEEQLRARIRQYIPLKIHTDAMIEAQKKAAAFEARMAQVRRVLEETIPRLARQAGANLSWIR